MRYLIIGLSLAQIALLIIMIVNQFAMPKGYEIPAPSWVSAIVLVGLPIASLVYLRRKSETSGYRVSRWW
jgi:hypothetical protein